jgi:hypothetical protein
VWDLSGNGQLAGRAAMNKYWKHFILEDLDTVRRIRIGKFWGVDLFITPIVWLSPFIFFGLYFLINLLNNRLTLTERLVQASFFTFAVGITMVLHSFGHILGGKLVNSSMSGLLIAATRHVNVYDGDQSQISSRVHLARSLGGPLFNLLSAGIFFILIQWMEAGFWMRLFSSLISVNLFFGLGSFLPIPSVDGEVIWREIRKLISSSKK